MPQTGRIPRPRHPNASDETGFGLVEIVISMFLVAVLALAFLPVLAQAAQIASVNAVRASATQIVVQQLEQVGALGSSCSAVKAFAATVPAPVADARGTLQPHLTLTVPAGDVCVEPYLRVVLLRVWVTRVGSSAELASTNTLILLDAP
jgi:Tfp pilus assembly protein PilV